MKEDADAIIKPFSRTTSGKALFRCEQYRYMTASEVKAAWTPEKA